ncbi:MAG: DUF2769 domain-containing protein [Thermoplasmata archaeon]|nr:DUF2769 domain-containing protein [Thermoplasmata archaeon]
MQMSPEEMEQRKNMVLQMCICSSCPSWVERGEKGRYCFPTIGKSGYIIGEKGCTCPGCPATAKMGLKRIYFCTKGPEMEQSSAQALFTWLQLLL